MMTSTLALLCHEWRLQCRNALDLVALVLFFVIVLLFLPFAIGPEPQLLQRLAPGLIWIAALLMTLLSLDRLFQDDAKDGTLDLMLLSPYPMSLQIFTKLSVLCLVTVLAVLLMLLPASVMLGLAPHLLPVLALTLLLGVPSLILIGGVMASLTLALKRNAALLTLLLAPFYIPVLIFAVGATESAAADAPIGPNLLFLGAGLALLLPAAPLIIAYALREGADA